MNYDVSPLAVVLFLTFVGFVLGLSFWFARKAKSAEGYFAAGGTVHWFINGIAFAGDYLSAASFLGICGLIATKGYDGFLYSIGYLAGWVVALFVVAEPMKRLGKYTFADALDSKFNSKGIQLTAAISTLAVSIFYLIPQMVGAGVLVTPLLGFDHWVGVCMVGAIVVFIVATAGMTSTTYVQFMKGGLLIIFSTILCVYLFQNGFTLNPKNGDKEYHQFLTLDANNLPSEYKLTGDTKDVKGVSFVELSKEQTIKIEDKEETKTINTWWKAKEGKLIECLSKVSVKGQAPLYNGAVKEANLFHQVGRISDFGKDSKYIPGTAVSPFKFISIVENATIEIAKETKFEIGNEKVQVWSMEEVSGKAIMKPGLKFLKPKIKDGKKVVTGWSKFDFISLMLALFLGTASLPHILIRYYTVPSQRDARKSTILAIVAIGFFYILTLFMGLGAMTHGVMNVESGNMAAPLLAKGFTIVIFSIISAIAFATVLGTVSGLIVATSGAIANDLMANYMGLKMNDNQKVMAGKTAAVGVGIIAIILGILFKGMNVGFLVGWAFAVAASANLPSIIMLLFWKKTTAKGIAASVTVGMISSLAIILVSPSICKKFYGMTEGFIPFDAPALFSVPLAFIVLIVVSLMTQKDNAGLKDINE